MTSAAIIQQARTLEDDLGAALFHRDPRGVTPITCGGALQSDLAAVFLGIRNGVERVREAGATTMRLEASGPIFRKRVLARLIRFTESYPDISDALSAAHPRRPDLL